MPTLTEHNDFLTAKHAERKLLQKSLDALRLEMERDGRLAADTESARDVVNAVLLLTQEKVRGYVEEVVSLALSTVYGGEYGFELEYGIKRNQAEATPWVLKDGQRISPRDETGGGVLDICSFALRLALWSMMSPRSAPFFVFDEPAKFLSRDRQRLFGEVLCEMSRLLGVQVLIVTHSDEIVELTDAAYLVEQEKGISKVTKL